MPKAGFLPIKVKYIYMTIFFYLTVFVTFHIVIDVIRTVIELCFHSACKAYRHAKQ